MLKKIIIFLWVGTNILLSYPRNMVEFKVTLPSDTVVIGEPFFLKCEFINVGGDTVAILPSAGALLDILHLEVYLTTPAGEEYFYRLSSHADVLSDWFVWFLLPPGDSVYSYQEFWWRTFTTRYRNLAVEEMQPGRYKLRVIASPICRGPRLEANLSFFGKRPTSEDIRDYQNLARVTDFFIYTPYPRGKEEKGRAIDIYWQMAQSKFVLAPYAHYLYARVKNTPEAILSFSEKYPNHPGVQELGFELVSVYKELGQLDKAEEVRSKLLSKYPNHWRSFCVLKKDIILPPLEFKDKKLVEEYKRRLEKYCGMGK